ncbi:hypothetical protein CVD28_22615 [Bacillus sp. M6-12]|uniref:hypothetical protein n=1 Tax=Bacillus sp. M6-12 TaxID=2054166 RepID=UPI000C7935B2|nr:hypothetical protein [Bacillus sp. M6-12]PLS15422.1 hypothetical protein CVD28_22615 [Bacillus sp. M6-12]
MLKKLLTIISVPLVAVDFFIFYFWISDWEKLNSKIGLTIWVGSILLGVVIYFAYRNLDQTEKSVSVYSRLVFGSTLITIFLGVFAIIIEFITSSMQ